MRIINWGIIGTGRIASTFATALNSLDDVKLKAVASRDFSRAKEFAGRFKIEKAYGSYEELAKDPNIDVIYIGTPHSEHRVNSALCMTNGKSVLCEKPITVNTAECEYLISLAKEHKVFLMEAMWTKFLPVTLKVKNWIQEKRIGDVRHIKASFCFNKEYDINNRLYNPNTAGGALLDVGIYPITYVINMLGKLPDHITSSAVLGRSGVDEQNVIILKYDEGILADLSSAIAVDTDNTAVITGTGGKIVIPDYFMAEEASLYDEANNLIETFNEPFRVNGYDYEAREVNSCLREGLLESETAPLKNTLDTMKILDQIRAQWGLIYPMERKS